MKPCIMNVIDKLLSFSAQKNKIAHRKDGKMHLIKDENGNVIPHGSDHHDHDHGHEHCGNCNSDCQGNCTDEVVALLNYMLSHNEHHAEELDQMADNLEKLGMPDAAETIKEGVADFKKGNMRLGLALTLVKEHLKEA